MMKANGLNDSLLHDSIKVVHDDAIVNAKKVRDNATRVQVFVPSYCGKVDCGACYSAAEVNTAPNIETRLAQLEKEEEEGFRSS